MDSRCVHSASPITVSARTCQQWQVPPWSWILRTRRVESRRATYELHGVAANGLTICVCVCVCVVYVMYIFVLLVKQWRNCGWRWDNKCNSKIIFCSVYYLIIQLIYNFKHNHSKEKETISALDSIDKN
jgi:hypothetical protein